MNLSYNPWKISVRSLSLSLSLSLLSLSLSLSLSLPPPPLSLSLSLSLSDNANGISKTLGFPISPGDRDDVRVDTVYQEWGRPFGKCVCWWGGGGVIIEIGKVLARGWCPPEESVYKGLSLNHRVFVPVMCWRENSPAQLEWTLNDTF